MKLKTTNISIVPENKMNYVKCNKCGIIRNTDEAIECPICNTVSLFKLKTERNYKRRNKVKSIKNA